MVKKVCRALHGPCVLLLVASSSSPVLAGEEAETEAAAHELVERVAATGRALSANALEVGIVFLVAILTALIAGRIGRFILNRVADSFQQRGRELLAVTFQALGRSAVFVGFAVGVWAGVAYFISYRRLLAPGGIADRATEVLLAIAIGYVAFCLVHAVDAWLRHLAASTKSHLDDMLVPLVRTSLQATVVIFVLLYIAEVLAGRPIGTILAGLGIGGIAIGLAAQDTIKNFFGSLMLFSDRPFEIGDRIVIDGFDGPVEEVGFRSTRIRTLEGYLVTIPNGELASKTIQNIGKRPYIRRLMSITLTYDTPADKMQRAVDILKEILTDHEGMRPELPPRVYFNEFGSTSLNLIALYWYHPADFTAYSIFSERVNFEILRRFNQEGLDFAFPTQTLYLAGDTKRPLLEDALRLSVEMSAE